MPGRSSLNIALAAASLVIVSLVAACNAASPAPSTPPTSAPAAAASPAATAPAAGATSATTPGTVARAARHATQVAERVRIAPLLGSQAAGLAWLKPAGSSSAVTIETHGLAADQSYVVTADQVPHCEPGSTQTVASLSPGVTREHASVALASSAIRSLALENSAGQVVACGEVRSAKAGAATNG
jgi:hypothetical protein